MKAKLAGLVLLLLSAGALLMPSQFFLGGNLPTLKPAKDALHVPGFTFVTLSLALLLKRKGAPIPLVLPIAAAVILAVLTELVQPLFGRGAQLQDVLSNLIGIGVACGWLILFRRLNRPLHRVILITGLLAFFAYFASPFVAHLRHRAWLEEQFPVLAHFDSPEILSFLGVSGNCDTEVTASDSNRAKSVLKVTKRNAESHSFSSLLFPPTLKDWSGYERLRIDLHNPGVRFRMNVVVFEEPSPQRTENRFTHPLELESGPAAITIQLGELRSPSGDLSLDVSRIQRLLFAVPKNQAKPVFHVKRVWLE